jgi:MFS superfamily sulfate permease-like transporter
VLVVSQLGKLLGLEVDARDPLPQLGEVVRELGGTSGITLAVGAAALAVLLPLRHLAGRFPAALVVVGAIGVSWWLDLEERGVSVVGSVPSGFPDLDLPIPGGGDALLLLPYRLDDRLFFANAGYVKGRVLEAVRGAPTATRSLVFDAEAVTHVDSTGLAALEDLVRDLREKGTELSLARAKTSLIKRLDETELSKIPLHPTVRAAVEAAV